MFITASYLRYPIDPKSTSKPNSQRKSDMILDEVVSLVKKLRDSDLKRCNVIINVKRQEVVKCRDFQLDGKIVENPSYEALLEHFHELYPAQIDELLKLAQA
jgi:hypothetical protein